MADSSDNGSERRTVYEENEIKERAEDTRSLAQFLKDNPSAGALKVAAAEGRGMVPVENSRVYVTKLLDGDRIVFGKGITDNSGIVDDMVLPAPSRRASVTDGAGIPYAEYDVEVEKSGYIPVKVVGVPVFEGIKSIQNVSMTRKDV